MKNLKYRINAILSGLPSSVRKIKLTRIKEELEIKRSRLGSIRTAKIGDPINLKDWQLVKVADILEVDVLDVFTHDFKISLNLRHYETNNISSLHGTAK